MPTINDVIQRAKGYMPEEDLTPLRKAHEYAAKLHANKKRLSGEPYLSHLLSVTYVLAAMRLDLHSLMAGLLHGALKEADSPAVAEQEVRKLFGKDVAVIVSGTTKIANVHFNSRLAYQAENVRKMFLAMSTDIRVLLIKLADRFDDMKTLEFLPRERQLELAKETLELYAPLASRLGIDWMKRELEDLAFSFLHPVEFADLSGRIETSLADRESYVEEVKA
ncbi:MAG: HD domain-containing protein, partial [Desulfobulbaceae bacterium]|nr:HD domain-containing protein [Desulfobulbaceae bacterium]